jgi:hypothetical protein
VPPSTASSAEGRISGGLDMLLSLEDKMTPIFAACSGLQGHAMPAMPAMLFFFAAASRRNAQHQQQFEGLPSPSIIRRGEGCAAPWPGLVEVGDEEPQWRSCSWSKGGRRRRTRPGHFSRNLSSAQDADVEPAARVEYARYHVLYSTYIPYGAGLNSLFGG